MKKSQLKEAIKNEIKSLLSETRLNQNVGLAHIKSSGENDGGRVMMSHLKHNDFKNSPDMEAYTDGFVKGASNSADYLKSKLGQAVRGGGDEESLMGLVGLKEGFRDIEDNYGLGDHDYEIDDYEIGDQVVVANNFTTDPLNKQGEMGVVTKVDIEHEIVEVTFKDRKTGRYYPGAVIFPGSPGRFADIREDRKAKEYIQSIEDPEEREAEKKRMFGDDDLKESLNPEVSRAVDRFITDIAVKYGYSMQDAVYAIMAALKQRNYDGLNESEDMDDDEMDKAAAKSAKKGDSITSTSNKLQKLTKQMKDVAGSYKRAKKANATNDMEKYVEQLKKMTTEKKKLEKAL